MTIACILIAGGKRADLLDNMILPRVEAQLFAEILVVGEHHPGPGYRYLHVPALSRTTNDALVKRDVGTLASKSEWLFYVSDDHIPHLRNPYLDVPSDIDVVVPSRFTIRDQVVWVLNNGEADHYCGGHGGVFRRTLIQRLPWSAGPHHREWDLLMSRCQQELGAKFLHGNSCVQLEDVEPGATPWL